MEEINKTILRDYFETSISLKQKLTFNYISDAFEEINIDIYDKIMQINLNLIDENNNYNNLALLLSDQNPFTIKIAVYESYTKENFLDRKEFSGSLLKIYDYAIDYLKLNSSTYGLITTSIRKDIEEYPEFVLREIILNSLIHRDYSSFTSNTINIYKNKEIEFISYGSLFANVTIDDILSGLSASRNPYLQSIFMRLKRVEAIGSGLRRVNSYYNNLNLKLNINALPSCFIVTIPSISLYNVVKSDDDKIITDYLTKNKDITRKDAEKLIKKEKTLTANKLNEMVRKNILIKIGNGPSTRYMLNTLNRER